MPANTWNRGKTDHDWWKIVSNLRDTVGISRVNQVSFTKII